MNVKSMLRDYASTELLNGQNGIELDDNTDLIENGLIDSVAIMKLLTYLEDTFSVQIDQENLVPQNFETIESICQMVVRMTDKS